MQDARAGGTYPLDPLDPLELVELVAILEEVRRAVLAVDSDTAEHRPLGAISLTRAEGGDTVTPAVPSPAAAGRCRSSRSRA